MATTITIDISSLPERLQGAVAEIASRRGPDRPLTLDDVIEARETAQIGERMFDGEKGPEPGPGDAHLDAVIGIPGALLHRPTYGCHIRLMRTDGWAIPERWADRPATWVTLVAAYVLAHAYDEAACAPLASPEQGVRVVEAWGATLDATPEETSAAVRTLLGDAYPPVVESEKKKTPREPTPSPPSYAHLCRARGARAGTGSGKSPRHTCAGCSGRSTAGRVARPRRRGTVRRPPWTRRTREPRRGRPGAGSSTDS